MSKFTHLHVHTEYSLLDGYAPIEKLVSAAKDKGMDSLAITDHGSMFGIVQFYKICQKYNIKPILGCEIYISKGNYLDKTAEDKEYNHLVVLAENQEGYKNLMKIVSEAYINGYYYKPRVDKDILRKYSNGIIALSACLGGEVQRLILNENFDAAKEAAIEYRDIFGEGNFFLEVQDHGLDEQKFVNKILNNISVETGIEMVATNDVHYVYKDDYKIHDILLCIQTGKTIEDKDRMRFPTQEFYLKDHDEMESILGSYKGAIENTNLIADRCDVKLDFGDLHLPHFDPAPGFTNKTYLRDLTFKGLKSKYGEINDEIRERAETELEVIENMGYIDYFLIVWDFIRYAKENGISVGPGRGSAAGSLISYALDITGIDPLKYDLIFERFLNPERISMPDIDIDFCYERRDEVIDYVINKYGEDHVAQIVTFGTMAARGAIRDVGRVLNMPYASVDKIAKLIPMQLGITIDLALELNPDLKREYDSDPDVKRLIDYANALEGMPRHTSTHAAGVVISKDPVTDYVPLSRNQDVLTTQFNMTELEELGLLKMDFLGLRTLTVIANTIKIIKKVHGIDIDIDSIDLNDPKVMQLFTKAETLGIFQFESQGMRAFLKELKPNVFDDLIAANSLFRPGPMNEIPKYIACKHNPEKISYIHPSLEPILDVTYGTIVYQEQVMQIVQQLAGYTLGGADLLRRAMGKKKMETMEKERQRFIYGEVDDEGNILVDGCIRRGVDEKSANKIYDLMIDFAKYAFNKSHSAAYAYVAMQTAWLKTYYPTEFMASLMSSVMGQSSQINLYIQECKRLGIEILPPDINHSFKNFSVDDGKIRFGMVAVKNVGAGLVDTIIKCRKQSGDFRTFTEFVERMDSMNRHSINKKAIECLIKVGAFSSTGLNRATLISMFEKTIDSVLKNSRRNIDGQMALLDDLVEDNEVESAFIIPEYSKSILMQMEKELTGLYISDHPLSSYSDSIKKYSTFKMSVFTEIDDFQEIQDRFDQKSVTIVGLINARNDKLTRKNQKMCFLDLEDEYGNIEVVVFPNSFDRYRSIIREDAVVKVRGRLGISENDKPKLTLESVEKAEINRKSLFIKINEKSEMDYSSLKRILNKYSGMSPVVLYYAKEKEAVRASKNLWVDIDNEKLIDDLKSEYGFKNVIIQ
ncbi:MAG: DNA polymerase III subunit alpha [Tissierellia bacterium]|nr:DNA polymerase III subunit alpha [Tissierellia bacterium]